MLSISKVDAFFEASVEEHIAVEADHLFAIDRSVLLALHGRDETVERSARNLDRTTLTTVDQLNAWDLMRNRTLLLTKDGLSALLA